MEFAVLNGLDGKCCGLRGEDELVVVNGKVARDEYGGGWRMSAERVLDLARARQEHAQALLLRMNGGSDGQRLRAILEPFRARRTVLVPDRAFSAHDDDDDAPLGPQGCPVEIHYRNEAARCAVRLGDAWLIRPEASPLDQLRDRLPADCVALRSG